MTALETLESARSDLGHVQSALSTVERGLDTVEVTIEAAHEVRRGVRRGVRRLVRLVIVLVVVGIIVGVIASKKKSHDSGPPDQSAPGD